jgi:heme oxygenase
MTSLHQALKEQSQKLHERAHEIPYIQNLLNDKTQKESYVGHLRTLAIICGTLEHQIYKFEQPEIQLLLKDHIRKLPYLLKDLDDLNALHIKDVIPAVREALSMADKILIHSTQNPYLLIGYLYTLEGALNGGHILKAHIAKALELKKNQGLAYLSLHEENKAGFWPEFIQNINKFPKNSSTGKAILQGALETFYGIMKIYEHLYPIKPEKLGNHITSLNPEAGDHPIPSGPAEIEASIRAAYRVWYEFPYFSLCYGQRGKRFAVSDSAWLVTLCNMSAQTALQQAQWLSGFLAKAGMPVYTFERQLECLFDELTKTQKNDKYKVLKELADFFATKRKNVISDIDFEKSNSIFAELYKKSYIKSGKAESDLKNTGKLIAAAICDAKNGLPESEEALKRQLTKPELFNTEQIKTHKNAFAEIKKLTK